MVASSFRRQIVLHRSPIWMRRQLPRPPCARALSCVRRSVRPIGSSLHFHVRYRRATARRPASALTMIDRKTSKFAPGAHILRVFQRKGRLREANDERYERCFIESESLTQTFPKFTHRWSQTHINSLPPHNGHKKRRCRVHTPSTHLKLFYFFTNVQPERHLLEVPISWYWAPPSAANCSQRTWAYCGYCGPYFPSSEDKKELDFLFSYFSVGNEIYNKTTHFSPASSPWPIRDVR